MICKKCNTLNSNDAKVCVNCGQKLSGSQISKEKKSSIKPQSRKQFNPAKSSRGKNNSNRSDKKKSNLGILLIVLLIVIIGGGYILVNTDSGQKYVEDMKKNELVGEYVSLADSLLKSYVSDLNPEEKVEEPEEKVEEQSEVKKESDQPEKPEIVRVKRDMLFYRSLKDDMRMILIPSGTVSIGSEKGSINEKPVHDVYVEEFYIDEHEVTNSQFRIFVEETGYKLPRHILFDRFNGPNQPVVGVSFKAAQAYAKWAGKRLPTEFEWEKAARGGLKGLKYPYSNSIDPSMACYDLNPANDGPADVKSYGPNDYKIYDMAGNAAEWTNSQALPYPDGTLLKSYSEEHKVIRGGSWRDIKTNLTVYSREFKDENWTSNGVGFRCVMDN